MNTEQIANILNYIKQFKRNIESYKSFAIERFHQVKTIQNFYELISQKVIELELVLKNSSEMIFKSISDANGRLIFSWFEAFFNYHNDLLEVLTNTHKNVEDYSNDLERYLENITAIVLLFKEFIEGNIIQERKKKIDEILNEQQIDVQRTINEFSSQVNEFRHERNNLLTELNALKAKSAADAETISSLKNKFEDEIQTIKTRYAKDLSGIELMKQEQIFMQSARDGKNERLYWIVGIALLVGILIWVVTYFMHKCWIDFSCLCDTKNCLDKNEKQSLFYYELIKRATLRVFIISMLVFLLKFSVKNYNAIMHNRTINLHKANCFAAAITMINGINNERSQEIILKLASEEIFQQHRTGYLVKEETSNIDLNFIEKLSKIFKKE